MRSGTQDIIRGIPASPGIAIGRAYVLAGRQAALSARTIAPSEEAGEQDKYESAVRSAKEELSGVVERLEQSGNLQEAAILEGQLFLLDDPEMAEAVSDAIAARLLPAEHAVEEAFEAVVRTLEAIEDDYIRERIADIRDVKSRLIGEISGDTDRGLAALSEPAIIVAHDITPSMTAQMDKQMVLGFITEAGSATSHTSIMARTFGLPAVVGCGELPSDWIDGQLLIVDGEAGQIIPGPSDDRLAEYRDKQDTYTRSREELHSLRDLPAVTLDGRRFGMYGNIGTPAEVDAVLAHGGEGIGLFRTEFLFMDRDVMPTEEEQYAAYAEVLRKMDGKPVIIRTLDVGGDKEIPYLPIGKEFNPFMGWRAIRYCLSDTGLFKIQLRALLRASDHGDLRIMFPMISSESEIVDAKRVLAEAAQELTAQGVALTRTPSIGIMIEVPSAAVISDRLAQHVSFFSIGTNDLIQYTLAADRMNERVSYLYDARHPAVLRLIDMVCRNAKTHGVHIGMCGEMAGDPQFASLLAGLGVEEWSMSPSRIPDVKKAVLDLDAAICKNAIKDLLK